MGKGYIGKRANDGFIPWVLVRGILSAEPKGGSKVPADAPPPNVELSVLFGAWNTRQRWEVFDNSDNRRTVDCARVTDIAIGEMEQPAATRMKVHMRHLVGY